MNWEKAKNYGLIKIQPHNGSLELYYDMHHFVLVPNPNPYMIMESAHWQGNHVIARGRNQYGEPQVYVIRGPYEYERIP